MHLCPTCSVPLDRHTNRYGLYHTCARCHGRLVGVGVLRKAINRDAVNRLWRNAFDGVGPSKRPCPVCQKVTAEVTPGETSPPLHVDVCTLCHMVWCDGGEWDALPRDTVPPRPPEMSPKAKAALAIHDINLIRKRAERNGDLSDQYPGEPWKAIPALFGLPVEIDTRTFTRWPFVTWLSCIVLLVVYLITMGHLGEAIERWGFLPAHPWRYQGVTWISSMLLHGGWVHLIGNLYFLFIFGDDVEDFLGHGRTLTLFAGAGISGLLLHSSLDTSEHVPLIGASGAISGIICFYSLLLPHAQLGLVVRAFWSISWLRLPAWFVFVLWVVWQFAGSWMQLNGFINVSSLAHLGGVLFGFVAWLVWRDPVVGPPTLQE